MNGNVYHLPTVARNETYGNSAEYFDGASDRSKLFDCDEAFAVQCSRVDIAVGPVPDPVLWLIRGESFFIYSDIF